MTPPPELTILGGGPGGLAAAYFARQRGIPFTLYEAAPQVGGNARTLQWGPFRYDTGAHRFHDRDPAITHELKALLGEDLRLIDAPSQIYHEGALVDFPFNPFNLLQRLGPGDMMRAAVELLAARARGSDGREDFASLAHRRYGRSIAERFLLNYSSKLWGLPAHRLSPAISGKRLQGLDLTTLVWRALKKKGPREGHMEGAFYYPRQGYGAIGQALAQASGWQHIRLEARVTSLIHGAGEVQAVVVNGRERIPVERVVSTLPLPALLQMLDPSPAEEVLDHAAKLRFRNLALLAIFLDRPRISPNASVYFPDPGVPFTRLYEPKNRSPEMAPPDQTVICVEFPCFADDGLWRADAAQLAEQVLPVLEPLGWIARRDIVGLEVVRMISAYPVLEVGHERHVRAVRDYLQRFRNLHLLGRNSLFQYIHVHDLLRMARELMDYLGQGGPES